MLCLALCYGDVAVGGARSCTHTLNIVCGPCPLCLSFPESVNRLQLSAPGTVKWISVMSAPGMGSTKTAHSDVSQKKKRGPGALATAYLVIYNVVMTAGYVHLILYFLL